jgi:hypothetical protein
LAIGVVRVAVAPGWVAARLGPWSC